MKHATDPAQLRRWLVTPRTGATPAEQACAIERYHAERRHSTASRWTVALMVVAVALAVFGVI